MCICSPGVVELVRSNLAPDFPLFHGSAADTSRQIGQGQQSSSSSKQKRIKQQAAEDIRAKWQTREIFRLKINNGGQAISDQKITTEIAAVELRPLRKFSDCLWCPCPGLSSAQIVSIEETEDWTRERESAASRCCCAGDVNNQSEMNKKVRMS